MGGGELWLVDATRYRRALPAEVTALKRTFFRLEGIARRERIGEVTPRGRASFSLGLLRVATILGAAGRSVRYFDLDQARALIHTGLTASPCCIGFTAVTPTVGDCASLADLAKSRWPAVRTVLGGPHAAASPAATQSRYSKFDCVSGASDWDAAEAVVGEDLCAIPLPAFVDFTLLPRPVTDYGINTMTMGGCAFGCSYCQDASLPRMSFSPDGGLFALAALLQPRTPVHFSDSVLGGGDQRGAAPRRESPNSPTTFRSVATSGRRLAQPN